jgi:hypothetical protein
MWAQGLLAPDVPFLGVILLASVCRGRSVLFVGGFTCVLPMVVALEIGSFPLFLSVPFRTI